jgi:DNA-binding CsgD family transcriptional regulator
LADGSAPRSDNSPHLRRINFLMAAIFNAPSVGLAVFDTQARVVMSNPAFSFMIADSSASSCVGKTIRELLGGSAEELEHAIKQVWEPSQIEPGIEVLVRMPNTGRGRYWLFNLMPVTNEAEGHDQVLAITIESHHQKRVEQYLLTLMADINWIRDQISKPPSALQDRPEIFQSSSERVGLLREFSEELRTFSAMLRGEAITPPERSETVGSQLEPAKHGMETSETRANKFVTLSPREKEVLGLVASGMVSKEIAPRLSVTVRTVDTYKARLRLKLDLHSTTELVLYAVKHHIVSLDPL